MTQQELKDAYADLLMLWGDVEWWEGQGLERVRPTLKSAADAMATLRHERDIARQQRDALIDMVVTMRKIARAYEQWEDHWAKIGGQYLDLINQIDS